MIRVGVGSSALVLLALTGCEWVSNLDPRSVDPIPEGCTLPATGDGRLRVANLRPDATLVDYCVRSSGESYARPVLRGGGSACPAGYRYQDVSAPFAVRAGSVDVKMIAAGSACAAPALAELQNIAVDTAAVVTVASLSGQAGAAQLVALPEEPLPDGSHLRLRFLNALVGSTPLSLGLANDVALSARVTTPLLPEPVPFGALPQPGLGAAGQVDEHGYLILPSRPYQLGVAQEAESAALLALAVREQPATYSLFVIGALADNAFPPRGMLCDETTPATGLTLSCVETGEALVAGSDAVDGGAGDAGASDAGRAASPGLTGLDAGASGTRGLASGAPLSQDAMPPSVGSSAPATSDGGRSAPDASSATAPVGDAMVSSPYVLTGQYELNPVAPADIEIAPVLRITNVSSREPIPLKSLTMRYYFTNEHASECPKNCAVDDYYDNLSLGMTVAATWTFVQLEGKLGYLEVSFPTEAATLHRGESVQSFQGFHTTTYLPFDQSDDYSFIANQNSFVDSQKITIYRDGVLVWGTPPP